MFENAFQIQIQATIHLCMNVRVEKITVKSLTRYRNEKNECFFLNL